MIGIEYGADPEKAIAAIQEALRKTDRVDPENEPEVGIREFADSSINIGYRYWVLTEHFHKTIFAANLAVFKAIKEAGLSIPFPQRDVHLFKNDD